MLSLILTIAMAPAITAPKTAQVTTCQWPNKCATQAVAQVQTCVWPHVCVESAPLLPVLTAQVQTCVWPHVCKDATKI